MLVTLILAVIVVIIAIQAKTDMEIYRSLRITTTLNIVAIIALLIGGLLQFLVLLVVIIKAYSWINPATKELLQKVIKF